MLTLLAQGWLFFFCHQEPHYFPMLFCTAKSQCHCCCVMSGIQRWENLFIYLNWGKHFCNGGVHLWVSVFYFSFLKMKDCCCQWMGHFLKRLAFFLEMLRSKLVHKAKHNRKLLHPPNKKQIKNMLLNMDSFKQGEGSAYAVHWMPPTPITSLSSYVESQKLHYYFSLKLLVYFWVSSKQKG